MKINYAAAEAAAAAAAGAALAHPCPPPLKIFLLCLPSLCQYVCVYVVGNSHFLCLGSRTLRLICCANVQTISQRHNEHGETECLSYVVSVCVVIRLLNNIFHSFALPIKYIFIIIAKNSF